MILSIFYARHSRPRPRARYAAKVALRWLRLKHKISSTFTRLFSASREHTAPAGTDIVRRAAANRRTTFGSLLLLHKLTSPFHRPAATTAAARQSFLFRRRAARSVCGLSDSRRPLGHFHRLR